MEHYFSQNGLTACYTDTAITLFWDKPAAAGAVETYTILRNDTVADTTTRPILRWSISSRKRSTPCSSSGGAAESVN